MSRLSAVKRQVAETTGLHLRTVVRNSAKADLVELREIIKLFKERPMIRLRKLATLLNVHYSSIYNHINDDELEISRLFDKILFLPLDQKIRLEKL